MDHVRVGSDERRDFRTVLAGAELRHLRRHDLDAGLHRLDGRLEVVPGVLAVRVVLVDAGHALHGGPVVEQVHGRGDGIHRGVRTRAEHVLVAAFLEDPRRAAVEEHRELLELFGDRRDREAIAAADVADDHVDVLALDEGPVLGHLLRGAAGLVDHDEFDRQAADALDLVGRRALAGIERLDDAFGRELGGDTERTGCRPRQEGDEADLDAGLLLRQCRRARHRGDREPGQGHPEQSRQHVRSPPAFSVYWMRDCRARHP